MGLLEEILAAQQKVTNLRAALEPYRAECVQYLTALFGGAEPTSSRIFVGPKAGATPAAQHLSLFGGYDPIVDAILDGATGADMYVAIAPNRADANVSGARHGTVAEKQSIGCLWADFDIGDATKQRSSEPGHAPFFSSTDDVIRFLVTLPLEPNMVVHSGGGLHVYWLFDKHTTDLAGVQALVSALQRDLQKRARALPTPAYGPDYVPSPSQLLRPPGSLNHKRGEPKIVRLLYLSERRYSLEELRAVWPAPAGGKKVFGPTMPLDRELTHDETLALMRSSVLRAHKWEHQAAALKFLAGESWARPGQQDLVLVRIAWHLARACRWRPNADAVIDLCDAAADAVENSGAAWTGDQIAERFDSAVARGLAAAGRDASLLARLKSHFVVAIDEPTA